MINETRRYAAAYKVIFRLTVMRLYACILHIIGEKKELKIDDVLDNFNDISIEAGN